MLYNYRKHWGKKFKKYVNRLWMSVFVGVLTLVSLSLNKVIHLQYRGRRRGEPYKWSISLRRTERGKERAEHESRAEPSRAEPIIKAETFQRNFWKHHPPLRKQITFLRRIPRVWPIITLNPRTSNIFLLPLSQTKKLWIEISQT